MAGQRKSVKHQGNAVLRHLRDDLGISLKAFAGDVGVSRVFLWEVEAGKKRASLSTCQRIWSAYQKALTDRGYTFEDLCNGSRTRAA